MIKEYIESLLTTGLCSTRSEVLSHFQNMGIDTNVQWDLIQFKYNLITADWKNPLTHYCRGTIISWTETAGCHYINNVAVGFQKFFNRTEAYSVYKSDESFAKFKAHGKLTQKADGTCILLYYLNGWKCSTLGSIPTGPTGDDDRTFGSLFWELFDIPLASLNIGYTYIFELCTEHNQIVTKYDSNRLYYLGIVDNAKAIKSNMIYDWKINDLIEKGESKILLPFSIGLDETVNCWDDLTQFAEKHFSKNMGKNPEGVVGLMFGKPVFKHKFPNYITLHKTMSGDDKYVKKTLIKKIFEGTIDDIQSELTDNQKAFCERVISKITEIVIEYSNTVYDLSRTSYELPRDYASAVEVVVSTLKNKEFKGYLYAHRKTGTTLIGWLKEDAGDKPRYHKFIDLFKLV
jgi:hypothetical protein